MKCDERDHVLIATIYIELEDERTIRMSPFSYPSRISKRLIYSSHAYQNIKPFEHANSLVD
jgi:hypothetical protein